MSLVRALAVVRALVSRNGWGSRKALGQAIELEMQHGPHDCVYGLGGGDPKVDPKILESLPGDTAKRIP